MHVFRSKVLRGGVLHERLRLTNHGLDAVRFAVTFRIGADFVDVFEVRGSRRARSGTRLPPEPRPDGVRLAYRGLDGVVRRTDITATPRPARVGGHELAFDVALAAKEEATIELAIACGERSVGVHFDDAYRERKQTRAAELARAPRIRGSTDAFNRWIERSIADVYLMISPTEHGAYPYAGVPWYSTVFGRDGIVTSLFALWLDPQIARGTLAVLAATQADARDDARDAQPGKIVHELRTGEMAALGEIPFGRYYGTVDATPLFVVLAGAYLDRTGDLDTVRAIWPNLERALAWIDANAAADPRGFVTYACRPGSGLVQQGWKDSDDSIFHADGALAPPPIALCEVQGYVYDARRRAARIARRLGDEGRARALDAAAERLRAAFEDAFWLEDLGTYALALDGDGRPCRVRASNAGHCLASGLVAPDRAARVGALLMDPMMFTGWGVRTLADGERRYNPMSYHNGSVWPHDTALCAGGLARYGMTDAALAILSGLYDASQFMDLARMPELICGFSRKAGQGPTMYPVACSPQAWSAAAPMFLLAACLGLTVDGTARVLRFHRPRLPAWLDWLTIEGLRVGDAIADLRFDRGGVAVTRADGQLELVVT